MPDAAPPTPVYSAPLAEHHTRRIAEAGGTLVDLDAAPAGTPAVLLRTVGRQPSEAFLDVLRTHDDIVWMHTVAAGVDDVVGHVPGGVVLTRGPGPAATPVAEYAIAGLLLHLRRLPELLAGEQARKLRGRTVAGLTVAVLGWGPIGRAVADRLDALGAAVLVVRRRPGSDGRFEEHAADALVDVLRRSDALVVCCPLTEATRSLVAADALEALGDGGVLVNVARGAVVDHAALLQALVAGRLAGAMLDVTDPEPLPDEHPLRTAPNCVVTPHLAGFAGPSTGAAAIGLFCENLRRFRAGLPLEHVVDPVLGY